MVGNNVLNDLQWRLKLGVDSIATQIVMFDLASGGALFRLSLPVKLNGVHTILRPVRNTHRRKSAGELPKVVQ